jgi:hypothetical protein
MDKDIPAYSEAELEAALEAYEREQNLDLAVVRRVRQLQPDLARSAAELHERLMRAALHAAAQRREQERIEVTRDDWAS